MNHGEIGPWEHTPVWHWRSWCGYDVRRWIIDYTFHIGDDHWEYGRSKKVARDMLQSAYDPDMIRFAPAIGQMDWRSGRIWNGKEWSAR
jgi:hypothetical protein